MRFLNSLVLAGTSLFAFSNNCLAQEAGTVGGEVGANSAGGDDIIVTARRREEAVQDVPLVVNAVTSESIEKLNIRRYEDIVALVPGYSVANNRTSAGVASNIRGVDYNSGASGSNSTIEYYLNDAVAYTGTITVALFDVAQIEVLRGPQGTLRGRATPSGSINVTTRRPHLSEVGGYVTGTLNNHGERNFNGAINIPIVSEKLALRLAGIVAEDEASRVFAPNSPAPYSKTRAIRVSLRADPFEGVLLLDASYMNQSRDQQVYDQIQSARDFNPALGASPLNIRATDFTGLAGRAYQNDIRYEVFNWQAQLNIAGQRLVYVGANTRGFLRSSEPLDKAGAYTDPSGGIINNLTPSQFRAYAGGRTLCSFNVLAACTPSLAGGNLHFSNMQTTFNNVSSHELRLQNEERVAGIFDYVVGGFLYDTNPHAVFNVAAGLGLGGTFPVYPANTDPRTVGSAVPTGFASQAPYIDGIAQFRYIIDQPSRERSLFGNLTAHLGEDTEISAGVRRIWYKTNFSQVQYSTIGTVIDPGNPFNVDEAHTIYAVSGKHRFTPEFMVYGTVASSYRPGNIVIAPFPVSSATALQQKFLLVQPETSTSYELGFKSDWFDRRLRLNVTGFYQKFQNYQYRLPSRVFYVTPSGTVDQYNFAASVPVEVRGVEAELGLTITDRFRLGAVLSFVDGKIKNALIPCNDINGDGVPDAVSGTPTAAALGSNGIGACPVTQNSSSSPRWSGAITADYSHPVTDRLDAFARGLFSWKGDSEGDSANAIDSVAAYGLLNLYLGLKDPDDSWEVSLFGKNITNAYRALTRDPAATAGAPASVQNNYYIITSSPPREFGINVRFAFGSR